MKIKKKNKENISEEDVYFYIMTLQADGQRHQIKIFENSNASELAFNFCKTYNLDFQTMKYLKKCIKQIILHFNTARKNEMIYLLKDNSSIQEVAEEEIITENSLKKSSTYKKNNSNNFNINSDENVKIKKNISKDNINAIKTDNKNNECVKKNEKINENKIIIQKENNEKESNNKNNKNIIEDDDNIELKDYSIDYCLENESVEVFPPTDHTTKIEQKSSIKNSYSLNQKKNCELQDKKRNSKNKKLQFNHNTINYNRINKKQNCLFNLNKTKKEKNKNSEIINNDLKNILIQYKDIKVKEKSKKRSKTKSRSKSKSKEKTYEKEKNNDFMKQKYYIQYNKDNKSLERLKIKTSNKTTFIDNKKNEISKKSTNNQINNYNYSKINMNEKLLSNMNELKNKYFSNYYNYFIKTRNINNTLSKNGLNQNYSSINQDSNRSKSISQNKINKNMTQVSKKNKIKKEIKINHLNTLNYQNINNNSKLNLNTILKKDSYSKEKQRTVFKYKLKNKYNIICNKNSYIFNKTINGKSLTTRAKIKNVNGKELFMESKKINSYGIKKMVTESLLNIHKLKEPIKDKKKKNIYINGSILKGINNKDKIRSRNICNKEIFFKNDSNTEKSINLPEKLYFESGNNNVNGNIKNNKIKKLTMRNKRNITDINLIKKI